MRLALLPMLVLSAAAHADLYRWLDPGSGSVKFSNTPPPWYESGSGPQVERIPDASPGARPAAADSAAPDPVAVLQARWRELLLSLASQPTPEGAQALIALTAQLDRADPAGARRRQQEVASVLAKVQR